MKKKFLKVFMLFFIAFTAASFSGKAQFVVIRPAEPVYERPMAPSPRHVWVGGEWVWRGGAYVYVNGYWAEPRPGFVWVPGHWRNRRHGWAWVPGHWRR